MPSRQRYDAGGEALANLLSEFVEKWGKRWLRYPETANISKTAVDVKAIHDAHDVLAAVHSAGTALCFSNNTSTAAVKQPATRHHSTLRLQDHQVEDWISTMDSRLRCLTYAVRSNEGARPSLHGWRRFRGVTTTRLRSPLSKWRLGPAPLFEFSISTPGRFRCVSGQLRNVSEQSGDVRVLRASSGRKTFLQECVFLVPPMVTFIFKENVGICRIV